MEIHLFYAPDLSGDSYILDEAESKHAIRVLRLSRGTPVALVDGKGGWYEATVEEDHPKRCVLHIHASFQNYHPVPYHLHLAIAPTKQIDRFEWLIEKITELGISAITPLLCERSERTRLRMDRLERIMVSAIKQSHQAYLPDLNRPVPLEDFLDLERQGFKGIAHCLDQERIAIGSLDTESDITILIGPEGDFTPEEVNRALKAGYIPLDLGTTRLRTETAGVFAVSAIKAGKLSMGK